VRGRPGLTTQRARLSGSELEAVRLSIAAGDDPALDLLVFDLAAAGFGRPDLLRLQLGQLHPCNGYAVIRHPTTIATVHADEYLLRRIEQLALRRGALRPDDLALRQITGVPITARTFDRIFRRHVQAKITWARDRMVTYESVRMTAAEGVRQSERCVPDVDDEIERLYRAGATLADAARSTGVSVWLVRGVVERRGLYRRYTPRCGQRRELPARSDTPEVETA